MYKLALSRWKTEFLKRGLGSKMGDKLESAGLLAAHRKKMMAAPSRIAREKGIEYDDFSNESTRSIISGAFKRFRKDPGEAMKALGEASVKNQGGYVSRIAKASTPGINKVIPTGATAFSPFNAKPGIGVSVRNPKLRGVVGLHELAEARKMTPLSALGGDEGLLRMASNVAGKKSKIQAVKGSTHVHPSVIADEARNLVYLKPKDKIVLQALRRLSGEHKTYSKYFPAYGKKWEQGQAKKFVKDLGERPAMADFQHKVLGRMADRAKQVRDRGGKLPSLL